jgi:hypothetical protein
MKSCKFQTILDEDLENILKSISLFERIQNGDVLCSQCGVQITLKNLQLLIPMPNKNFEFVCSDPKCIETYYEKGGK